MTIFEEHSYYVIRLQRSRESFVLVGPYKVQPIIAKKTITDRGIYWDILIGDSAVHVVTDQVGNEYMLVEMEDILSSVSHSEGEINGD